MEKVFIQNENVDHIRLTNTTGADLEQYELTVMGGLVLIADEAIAAGEVGSLHAEEGIICQADGFVSGEGTFGTANAPVYWKPSTGEFSDTPQDGYYKVGVVSVVKDSGGVVKFTKLRNAVALGDIVAPGQIGYLDYTVDSDHAAGVDVDFGFNFTILDVVAYSEATVASETMALEDSAGNAITSALDIDTVDTRAVPATIDGANSYNEITDGIVKFDTLTAAGRARVLMLVKGV